jgi:hypothetical protein
MGNSNNHNHLRVPIFLAGHACNRFKGGLHVQCKPDTPQANVLLTVAGRLGLGIDSIGDSTGIVSI